MRRHLPWLVLALAAPLIAAAVVASPRVVRSQWNEKLDGGAYRLSYAYPQVYGLSSALVQTRVNEALKSFFEPDGASMGRARNFIQQTHGQVRETRDYILTLLTDDVVSVKFTARQSLRPPAFSRSLTLDLHSSQPVTLRSLFKRGSDYRNRLYALSRPQLMAHQCAPGAFPDGFHYYLRPHTLVLFQGDDDCQEIALPARAVADILNPDGPLQP